MFGFFGKRKPKTLLDQLIIQMYGSLDHKKTADLKLATDRAYEALLCRAIDLNVVQSKASELFSGRIPYSTNDLALSVALAFFKDDSYKAVLSEAQLVARMQLLEWINDNSVARPLAMAFETTLYNKFKP